MIKRHTTEQGLGEKMAQEAEVVYGVVYVSLHTVVCM